MSLLELGWTEHFENSMAPYRAAGGIPARVVREDRGRYRLLGEMGEQSAGLSGRMRHGAAGRRELPAVGDWVVVKPGGGLGIITALLPRFSAFVRKVAGETTEEQIVAANVDSVFLVAGLDLDLNLRRLERYLVTAWESGATPVFVLNKADLADDLEARIAEVAGIAAGTAVVPVSALEGRGLDALGPWLLPGRTVALLGSSGVGKSTLLNALLGEEKQATGAVRESDSRGRHTTTHRELVPLSSGALLLDTPGMRELQLWGDECSADQAFPDVVALAQTCRFTDCSHDSEPGCAVKAALREGALDAPRFEAWRKLQRELRRLEVRSNSRARAEETAKWKAIHKSMKQHPKAQRWRR